MRVYYDSNLTQKTARLFPYAAAKASDSGYIDFRLRPDLIDTSLEDFKPISQIGASQAFFQFLRWINGPQSHLMTCDSGFRQPGPHQDRNSQRALSAHGRVFVLYRDLMLNSSETHADWLCGRMMKELDQIDPAFPANDGVVGFTQQPALQTEISNGIWHGPLGFEAGENDPGLEKHLMLSYWGYGDSDIDAFASVERIFRNIWDACRIISDMVDEAKRAPEDGSPTSK